MSQMQIDEECLDLIQAQEILFQIICVKSVSYTHLEVYKRQSIRTEKQ